MKKLKKSTDSKDKIKSQLFELETKCSRVTIDSRICNIDKFNQFYEIIDNTKEFKMSDFIITNDKGYALAGQYLTSYKLRDDFYKTPNTTAEFAVQKAYRAVSGEDRKPVTE